MWDAIRSNRRRSWILVGGMGGLLVLLGALIGASVDPSGAAIGALVALGVWLVLLALATAGGDGILLASVRAREIREKQEFPRLWNVVEEMTIAAGLPKMPRIFLIEDVRPNAFAVGLRPEKSSVAVTSGLLRRLNRDELQGVIAHEIGHIVNRDMRFMTIAGVMLGAIVLVADLFLRSFLYGGVGRRRSGGKGGDARAQAVIIGVALLVAILAPLFARLLYFACSRRREYLADASSACFTRYPEGLASALEKITTSQRAGAEDKSSKNRTLAPLYIINPLNALGSAGLFSTHPPTEKRVAVLRSMSGAEYAAFEAAYRKVMGKGRACLGERTLAAGRRAIEIREATPEPEPKKDAVARAKEVADVLDRIGGWAVLACPCGVGIKVPPGLDRDVIACPRCGTENRIPAATESSAAASPDRAGEAPLDYRRQGRGWESFRCRCGNNVQLSPAHVAPTTKCAKCGRKISILGPAPEPAART